MTYARITKLRKGADPRLIHLRAAILCAIVMILAGCASEPSDPADKAVPATDIGRMQAWRDAEAVAAMGNGRMTVIGAGESMLPVYGEGTVLVLSKVDFSELKTGMQVAYVNNTGKQVVHVLVSLDEKNGNWRVRGLNNENEDYSRVTPGNLLGVVYASFAPGDGLK